MCICWIYLLLLVLFILFYLFTFIFLAYLQMRTSSVFFVVASIMAAAVLASGSHSEMPQHRHALPNPSIERSYMPEPHPMASFYQHQRLQQSPVKTSRLFSVFETPGLLKVSDNVTDWKCMWRHRSRVFGKGSCLSLAYSLSIVTDHTNKIKISQKHNIHKHRRHTHKDHTNT